jgi:hypothetical protein
MASQDDFMKTALRLPRELHAKLHESALDAGRSYNAEILHRLEQSFDRDSDNKLVLTLEQKLEEMEASIKRMIKARESVESVLAKMGADANFLAKMDEAFNKVISMTEGGSKPKGPPQRKRRG